MKKGVKQHVFRGAETGEQSLFHLPTVKSVKALLCMCDFAFQNCNTVSCKDCNAKMKSEGVVFIILRKSFSVFSVWSVDNKISV